MEALHVTTVLVHDEHTVEKNALQSSNTIKPRAQEAVVQNSNREIYPGMGGKYLRRILLSLPQVVY
jgi:hypothetical protein